MMLLPPDAKTAIRVWGVAVYVWYEALTYRSHAFPFDCDAMHNTPTTTLLCVAAYRGFIRLMCRVRDDQARCRNVVEQATRRPVWSVHWA